MQNNASSVDTSVHERLTKPRLDRITKPVCITIIQSTPPLFVQTTAEDFRSVVQGLTGQMPTTHNDDMPKPGATTNQSPRQKQLQIGAQGTANSIGNDPTHGGYASVVADCPSALLHRSLKTSSPANHELRSYRSANEEMTDFFHWDLASLPALIDVVDEKQLPAPIELEWDDIGAHSALSCSCT